MKVSPQYLVDHYDDVASAVNGGEEVEVALPEKPVLRLVPSKAEQASKRTEPRVLGAGKTDVGFLLEKWDEIDRDWRKSFEEKFGLDETC